MKQTASIISTYSADTFGVCSALFELGGMIVMHDPSGCNSTYTTHDEPRWYDMDSMLYISGLTEIDAIMGNDAKLVHDVAETALEQQPAFIVLAGSPIPMMIGTDFSALAALVEQKTHIPSIGLPTNSMHSYVRGISLAFEALAKRLVNPIPTPSLEKHAKNASTRVNIIGLTPLDFSNNGSDASMRQWLTSEGFVINSTWAMGSSLEDIRHAGTADVNLVVTYGGLAAARVLQQRFQTPYVIGTPIGSMQKLLGNALLQAAATGECISPCAASRSKNTNIPKITIIGESICSISLATAVTSATNKGVQVLCPLETEPKLLGSVDHLAQDETDIIPYLQRAEIIIADPMYEPICPQNAHFVRLPHEGFSGRLYRKEIPDLIKDFTIFKDKEL